MRSRPCWRRCCSPEQAWAARPPPRSALCSQRCSQIDAATRLDRAPSRNHWTNAPRGDTSVPEFVVPLSDLPRSKSARVPGERSALTPAQAELYDWLQAYIRRQQHSPSIRQMMEAMGLRSPAPVQSRLRHLQQKGWITWKEGQARTLQLLGGDDAAGIPVRGAVAAGGLVQPFDDVHERLDLLPLLETRGLFALTVNGDSMVEAHITDGDVVLMEPVRDPRRLRNGTIVSALVPGSGTTLKHFHRQGEVVRLEAANRAYAPLELPAEQVEVQGRLVAVWREV